VTNFDTSSQQDNALELVRQQRAEIDRLRSIEIAVIRAAQEVVGCEWGKGAHPCRDGLCWPRLKATVASLDGSRSRKGATA
jgi:hypothetical protein